MDKRTERNLKINYTPLESSVETTRISNNQTSYNDEVKAAYSQAIISSYDCKPILGKSTRAAKLRGFDESLFNKNNSLDELVQKLDSIKITTKEIEDWLQEVLSKAELQQIPDIIANPQYKNPIYRYGLDR